MYISKKLLSQLNPDLKKLSNKEIVKNLNQVGIEVENVIEFKQTQGLKYGKILEVQKHFNADNVQVCQLKVENKTSQIVCGAKTLSVGENVIVAQDDVQMIDGRIIGTKNFRGVESEGMMCDYFELSGRQEFLSDLDFDEIINLSDKEVKQANNIFDAINLDDVIFEVALPTNRNDLNSLLAINNELNALLQKKHFEFTCKNKLSLQKIKMVSDIDHDFFGIKIDGVNYFKTNWKTKSFLMNSGIKPLNTIQDIANITTIFTAIPLIAVDGSKIDVISIERLAKTTTVNLTNFGKVTLKKNDLVYKSKKTIIGVVGIGECTAYQISNQTKTVIFLAASVDLDQFKKTIQHLKLNSDMIRFYSKKISNFYYQQAFINLISTLNAKYTNIFATSQFKKNQPLRIKIDYELIAQIIGIDFKKTEIDQMLKNFDIKIENNFAIVPNQRVDLENNHDLAEEILKIISINNLPAEKIKTTQIRIENINDYQKYQKLATNFVAKGFYQIKNYNLTSSQNNEIYNWYKYEQIEIQNPISIEKKFLRLSLLSSLLECYNYNSAHKNQLLPIFEIQKIYHQKESHIHFCFMVPRQFYSNRLTNQKIETDIHLCKEFLNIIENHFAIKFEYRKNEILKYTCNDDAIDVYWNQKPVGYLGRTCPNITKQMKISDSKTYLGEINLSLLDKKLESVLFTDFEKIHPIIKELTFWVQSETLILDLYENINNAPNLGNFETISYFKKDNGIMISIKFEIIDIKPQEAKLAFNKILKYFKNKKIMIPN